MAVFSRNTLNRFIHALTSQGAATEFFNTYNVTTKGTAEASKALVLDANKQVSGAVLGGTLTTGAGVGITGGTGTIYKNSVQRRGGLYVVELLIDLTGLASSTTDLDVIGVAGGPAYIAKLTAAEAGTTILTIGMQCLEAPAGGVADIDLYSAVEGTPVFDDGIAASTETALITAGGSWTNGTTKAATVVPASTEYLYLTGGAGGTAATYTAGKFLITIIGY